MDAELARKSALKYDPAKVPPHPHALLYPLTSPP